MKKFGLVFFMVLALIFAISAETIRSDMLFRGATIQQFKNNTVRCYNASGGPLIAGQAVVLYAATTPETMAITSASTTGSSLNYKVLGVCQAACDTGDNVNVITGGYANVAIAASQTDTTTAGGLILGLSTTEGYCTSVAGSSAVESEFDTLGEAQVIGYTLEAIGSNAATTGTLCFIYPRF